MSNVRRRNHQRRVTAKLNRLDTQQTVDGERAEIDRGGRTLSIHDGSFRIVDVRRGPNGSTHLQVADKPYGPLTRIALD